MSKMTIEVVGGIIKITSPDKIAAIDHANAEAMLRDIKKAAGGKSTHQHIGHKHAHSHSHEEGHTHQH